VVPIDPDTLFARVRTAAGGPLLTDKDPPDGNVFAYCKLTGAVGKSANEKSKH
jgi:hypothetical protein